MRNFFREKLVELKSIIYSHNFLTLLSLLISIASCLISVSVQVSQNKIVNSLSIEIPYCTAKLQQLNSEKNYLIDKIDSSLIKIRSIAVRVTIYKANSKEINEAELMTEVFNEVISISAYGNSSLFRLRGYIEKGNYDALSERLKLLDFTDIKSENFKDIIESAFPRIDLYINDIKRVLTEESASLIQSRNCIGIR